MLIRDNYGKLIKIDVEKLYSEKEFYYKMWKIKYNKNVKKEINMKSILVKNLTK
tara:strand:+ start:62 stop:223 length:162 start_codon:yes stop_codon:yes gene_type:complete